jgi:hypothetical protein
MLSRRASLQTLSRRAMNVFKTPVRARRSSGRRQRFQPTRAVRAAVAGDAAPIFGFSVIAVRVDADVQASRGCEVPRSWASESAT